MGRKSSSCLPFSFFKLFKKSSKQNTSTGTSETGEEKVVNDLKVCFNEEHNDEDDDVFEDVMNKDGRAPYIQQEGFDFRTRSSFKAMLLKTPLLSSRKTHSSQEARFLSHKMGFLGQIYVANNSGRERIKSASTGSLESRTKHNSSSSDNSVF